MSSIATHLPFLYSKSGILIETINTSIDYDEIFLVMKDLLLSLKTNISEASELPFLKVGNIADLMEILHKTVDDDEFFAGMNTLFHHTIQDPSFLATVMAKKRIEVVEAAAAKELASAEAALREAIRISHDASSAVTVALRESRMNPKEAIRVACEARVKVFDAQEVFLFAREACREIEASKKANIHAILGIQEETLPPPRPHFDEDDIHIPFYDNFGYGSTRL